MDDSKLRYFASAWLISITLPADSAERYNAQFVNGIDPLAFNQFVASDGDVMPGTYDVNIYINDLLVDSRPVRFSEDSAHGGLARRNISAMASRLTMTTSPVSRCRRRSARQSNSWISLIIG